MSEETVSGWGAIRFLLDLADEARRLPAVSLQPTFPDQGEEDDHQSSLKNRNRQELRPA